MNEKSVNATEHKTLSELDAEILRDKLLDVAEEWTPKLPDIIQNLKPEDTQTKMAVLALRPFLPRLGTGLIEAIETAEGENILKLVEFVDGVSKWLHSED